MLSTADVHPASWNQVDEKTAFSLQTPADQWMIKRSKAQKSLYERAFRIRDAQVGFPIYPVYTEPSTRAVDLFASMTKNTGFFGHLLNNAQVFAHKWRAQDKKALTLNWKFEAGPPFWINAMGRVVMHRARHFPTRDFWVREVLVSSNPRFFPFARGRVIRTAALADISTRPIVSESVWRKLVASLEAKYSTAIVNRVLESLIEAPRVENLRAAGGDMDVDLIQRNSTGVPGFDIMESSSSSSNSSTQRRLLPDILTPSKLLAAIAAGGEDDAAMTSAIDVAKILSDPANFDIRQPYDEARAALSSIANPAYVEAFIVSLLGRAAALDWCPFFIKIFDTLRARSVPAVPVLPIGAATAAAAGSASGGGDSYHGGSMMIEGVPADSTGTGMWQQFLVAQHTRSYFDDYLLMLKELDAEVLLAHMFQVVFGLDWGQEKVGLLCGNLDVRSALRFCPVDSSVYLYYEWRGKHYRVPTYGKVIKLGLLHMDQASLCINGQRHSSSRSSMNSRFAINGDEGPTTSHLDLLRLGATMRMFYLSKQTQIHGPQKAVVLKFVRMLDDWSTCISGSQNPPRRDDTAVAGMMRTGASPAAEMKVSQRAKDIDMLGVRQKCIDNMGEAQRGLCSWNAFVETPKSLQCPKAIPRNQQAFFDLFEIDVRQIPDKAIVYRLP